MTHTATQNHPSERFAMSSIVISIDADEQGVCFMAASREKFKNGRFKRFYMFHHDRDDRGARIRLPRWLTRALKAEDAEIRVEGGRQGKCWREFSAWCDATMPEKRAEATLVERLRSAESDKALDVGSAWNLIGEAADEIERLRAIEERVQRALDPFAESGFGIPDLQCKRVIEWIQNG